uniref:Uncharacterized protein n=1 Tax=Cacopsylla melanoneura TaxID=428564 RepID=A0A8D8M9F1_9HEMI
MENSSLVLLRVAAGDWDLYPPEPRGQSSASSHQNRCHFHSGPKRLEHGLCIQVCRLPSEQGPYRSSQYDHCVRHSICTARRQLSHVQTSLSSASEWCPSSLRSFRRSSRPSRPKYLRGVGCSPHGVSPRPGIEPQGVLRQPLSVTKAAERCV